MLHGIFNLFYFIIPDDAVPYYYMSLSFVLVNWGWLLKQITTNLII